MLNLIKAKKFKGITAYELMGVLLVIIILATAAGWMVHEFVESGKRATTHSDAATLAVACGMYESQSKAGTPPADLGALVTGLTAAQSVDGVAKARYVTPSTWTSDPTTIVDQWNEAFVYDAAARTITSNNNGNDPIVKSF